MQARTSIPITRNYNEIWQNFRISLFDSYTKEKCLSELIDIDSTAYELMRNDVEKLFLNTGGYLGVLDFESCYNIAKNILKGQIFKSLNKNRVCFFEKNIKTNTDIYAKVVQRLRNNIFNLFDKKRINNIVNIQVCIIDDIYQNYEIDFTVLDIQRIANTEPSKLISAIYILLNNFELATDELIEICEKYNIPISNFSSFYFSFEFNCLKKMSNNQIIIDFESEVA